MATAPDRDNVIVTLNPWRPGLMTAGQQTSIPETELWKAKNVGFDLDGLMSKRPGLTQWGQIIKQPDKDAGVGVAGTDSTMTDFVDWLTGISGFTATDGSGSLSFTTNTSRGVLQTNVPVGTSAENYLLSRNVSALSINSEWAFRFIFRGTNLPDKADQPTETDTNTFVFRVQGAATSGKEFVIWSDGLYYKQNSDSKYVKITDSDQVGAGAWNCIDVQADDSGGNTLVYVNDTLLATLTSTDLKDVSLTGTSNFEFYWEVGNDAAGVPYSTYVTTPMYNDTVTDPFVARAVVAIEEYQYVTNSGAIVRSLVMAAGDYIYHDRNLEAGWRPLHTKQRANVHFTPYRTTIVWTDHDGGSSSSLWQWDGINVVVNLPAPPVRFVAEHQERLVAWGDILNPRRLYLSGDRQPDVWFAPSPTWKDFTFDEILDAGYLDIPSRGIEIKSFIGDYFGTGIVGGEKGFWKLGGYGVYSWQLDGLKIGTGSSNATSMVQVGNDIWSSGPQGIASVQASEKFGDLQAAMPSAPIQNLWNTDANSGDSLSQTFLSRTLVSYNVRSATVYMAMPLLGDIRPKNMYVYNTNLQKFMGPWTFTSPLACMATVQVASPVTEVTMVGNEAGQLGYFNQFDKSDFGTETISMEIETASVSGRSQNPQLAGMNKEWRKLRIYYQPRGDWDIDFAWWTDTDTDEGDETRGQLEEVTVPTYALDKDFRLDLDPDGFLQSGQSLIVKEIDLDREGHDVVVNIQQTGLGEDVGIQGIEIAAYSQGYEGD